MVPCEMYFAAGEFDMVIYDKKKAEIECFEIKHSDEIVEEQAKHLLNEDNIVNTEKMYGKVIRRCVLYKGGSGIASNGIENKNVEVLGDEESAKEIMDPQSFFSYFGFVFETICLEYMIRMAKNRKLPFIPSKYGKCIIK